MKNLEGEEEREGEKDKMGRVSRRENNSPMAGGSGE